MDYLQMLRNLTDVMDFEESAKHSFTSFHSPGLDYLNLCFSKEFTAKVYFINPAKVETNQDGYLVNPHTHFYNFHTYVVWGGLKHVRFKMFHVEHFPGDQLKWHRWEYKSPLRGGPASMKLAEKKLLQPYYEDHFAGSSYHVNTKEIHTLLVTEPVVLFLLQYRDNPKLTHTSLFTRGEEKPDCETGLYKGATASDCKVMWNRLQDIIF